MLMVEAGGVKLARYINALVSRLSCIIDIIVMIAMGCVYHHPPI